VLHFEIHLSGASTVTVGALLNLGDKTDITAVHKSDALQVFSPCYPRGFMSKSVFNIPGRLRYDYAAFCLANKNEKAPPFQEKVEKSCENQLCLATVRCGSR